MVDSVVIKWNNGKMQTIKNVKANQVLTVNIANAVESYSYQQPIIADRIACSVNVTSSAGINFMHKDPDFIDFNIQNLLPHKFSEYCPAIAAGRY